MRYLLVRAHVRIRRGADPIRLAPGHVTRRRLVHEELVRPIPATLPVHPEEHLATHLPLTFHGSLLVECSQREGMPNARRLPRAGGAGSATISTQGDHAVKDRICHL